MIEHQARTIAEAFKLATTLVATLADQPDQTPYCWFRGVNNHTFGLTPGAYWRAGYSEYGPMVSFCQEGGSYDSKVGEISQWDTYYLAQHHGIPTRLLDWTSSFSAALFFALDGWDDQAKAGKARAWPCIWILRPDVLNLAAINWQGIIAPNNFPQELDIWLPRAIAQPRHVVRRSDGFRYDNRLPIAIYPKRSNARILAQQGFFTVHGRDPAPIEDFLQRKAPARMPHHGLGRIVLKGLDKTQALNDLSMLGVHRASIYPDIDNFVLGLKEQYKW